MSRGRRILARVGLAAGALVLALGLGEAALRAQIALEDAPGGDDDWYTRYRRMNQTLYRRADDPALIYRPSEGVSVPMEYGPAQFNAAGMRDTEEHDLDARGRRRVAVVGDSLVWGEFLPVEDTIPLRLRARLGDGWEVLPFGVSGYDTAQEARWYEVAVRPYHPDVVVVVFCMNDMMIMSGPFERFATEEERAQKDRQEAMVARVAPVRRETLDDVLARREDEAPSRLLARAFGLYERWRFDDRYVDEYLVAFDDAPSRARSDAAIAQLGAAIAADGARGVFVISPVLERWDDYRWGAIRDHVRARAAEAGLEVVDPLEAWRGSRSPGDLRISGDNLHYASGGSEAMAEVIAGALEGEGR